MASVIKAVFFDLGDTLVERKPEVDEDSIKLIYTASGCAIPPNRELQKLRRRLRAAERATWNSLSPESLLRIETIEAEHVFLRDEFYPVVLLRLGFAVPAQDVLDELARRQLGPETFRCFSDVTETFVWLKSLGLKIGCISNALPSAEGILKHLDLWESFDCLVLSHRADCRCLKPSKRIHDEGLKRLGLTGKETIFIDDRPGFVTAATPIYGLVILLDRDCNHSSERLPKIAHLSDLLPLLDRARLVAGPNGIPFGQLPLFAQASLKELRARVLAVATHLLQHIGMPRAMLTVVRLVR